MATSAVLTVVLLQLFSSLQPTCGTLPDLGVIQGKTIELNKLLKKDLTSQSGHTTLEHQYEINKSLMQLERVDGLQLVRNMANEIGEKLKRKVDALKKSVEFAEKIAQEYQWDGSLELSEDDWVNAKRLNDSKPGYAYSEKFRQKVSYDNSSVHIPVEIYEGDINIVNSLAWTARLDEQWKANLETDSSLIWQFFGTQTGIFRKFPSSKWKGEAVDLYDVRRRSWYTQGASSPKDMLILVDTSGSTHGQALTLMKQSVRSLIDTLGENDFVNVARFSDDAGIVGCFPTFVQANYRNKKVLYDRIDGMQAKGMASYSTGLEFAFNQFKAFEEEATEGQGARCNRIIMFLTDGGTEMPEDVLRRFNWPEKKIRIFTYAVGPTANPVAAVRWIACANKGYFARIPAMGAIRSTVQDHVDKVARPLALQQARLLKWTAVYLDALHYQSLTGRALGLSEAAMLTWSTLYQDFSNYYAKLSLGLVTNQSQESAWTHSYMDFGVNGLGMMTTVTLPVYNRTTDTSNQTILGVMGGDVQTAELQSFTPTKELGPLGYSFAINNNGYVIFHPRLNAQKGFLKDPPNMDILDLELETPKKQELRREMIDGLENSKNIETWIITRDEKHLDKVNRTYYFTPIPHSNFSLAIVMPGHRTYYLKQTQQLNDSSANASLTGQDALTSDRTSVLLAPWAYCSDVVQFSDGSSSSEDTLYKIINEASSCDRSLVDHLLLDAIITAEVETKWTSSSTVGIDARFVSTNSGLTRVYPPSANQSFMNDLDPRESLYYQRAMNAKHWVYLADYHKGITDPNATEPVITAVKSITISGTQSYRAAVAGLRLEQSLLRDKLVTHITECGPSSPTTVCYLLDDGGYLILSSDEEDRFKVGQFFGDVDIMLMRHLVNTTVYLKNEKYDFQASCPVEKDVVSAGIRSVFVPAVMDMLTVNWWTSKLAWMYMQFNLYEWIKGYTAEGNGNTPDEPVVEANRSCVKLQTQYYFNDERDVLMKYQVTCGNCTRDMAVSRFTDSNLLLVMADIDCDGVCDLPLLNSAPVEKPDPLDDGRPDTCKVESRYRHRPAQCYDYDKREDDSDCGAGSRLLPSLWLMMPTLLLLHVFRCRDASC